MRDAARTLLAGLIAAFGMRIPATFRLRPTGHFWWLLALTCGLSVLRDRWAIAEPAHFYPDGIQADAFGALLTLAVAHLWARASGQRVLAWSAAVHLSSAGLWIGLFGLGLWQGLAAGGWRSPRVDLAVTVSLCVWWLLVLVRLSASLFPAWPEWRRGLGAALAAALTIAPPLLIDAPRYWYPDYSEEGEEADVAQVLAQARRVHGSAEALIYRQPAMLQAAIDRLQPGIPGQTDVYLLAFGGDGGEDVFRNEVEYADQVFAQRFGLGGRTLTLLNHPDTTDRMPLATLSNLKLALAGIAGRMNPQEDVLIVFLTSHGTHDHRLYVDMDPLPLDWITPGALREALDGAGIDWRVAIVSACYSGGFIDTLASPTTLVMTAAHADRPSFGCGADSEITYFGRAFLVDALNQSLSLSGAFEMARERVAQREHAEGFEPSDPQISLGALIAPRLDAWMRTLPDAPVVAFVPAVPKLECERDDEPCPPN